VDKNALGMVALLVRHGASMHVRSLQCPKHGDGSHAAEHADSGNGAAAHDGGETVAAGGATASTPASTTCCCADMVSYAIGHNHSGIVRSVCRSNTWDPLHRDAAGQTYAEIARKHRKPDLEAFFRAEAHRAIQTLQREVRMQGATWTSS
jgi:hypothetical protein